MLNQQLVLGRTYRFKFKSVFANHGAGSDTCLHKGGGVFRLEQIASFRDITTAGIKLYENFFEPLGITREEYAKYFDGKPADVYEPETTPQLVELQVKHIEYETQVINGVSTSVPVERMVTETRTEMVPTGNSLLRKMYDVSLNYSNRPIYKLVDVIDEQDIVYAPELAMDDFPEVDINQYVDVSLAIRLGYFQETSILEPMLQAVKDKLALYGVYYDNVNLIVTDTQWMSTPEYEEILDARLPGVRTRITSSNSANYLNKTIIQDGNVVTLTTDVLNAVKETEITITDANKVAQIGKTFEFNNDEGASELTKKVILDAGNINEYVGTTGKVYLEVYVVSSVASDRNYYYLYEMERQNSARLAAQVAALEDIVKANAIRVKSN